ncbi:PEP-CTERM sorting domain-containing protein [Pontiella agarivorans]|uniref:PEP-CTERM sorting domain-containing protein n=1 Tax=Pontiella agarivorans TaxID=3038953 RepID=A0ABU5MY72_9BACT|nr:PEP-CTERM sorting domain-containing protein [Pontiella agarivorans]MDZ8119153.1 PEP-CTERM sorting domain-containing protein [Pontiella agarivorans]
MINTKLIMAIAGAGLTVSVMADLTVWSENFDSEPANIVTTTAITEHYLGGSSATTGFEPGVWIARTSNNLKFNNQNATVSTANNTRGAGIVLAASVFTHGAGTYTLNYDVNLTTFNSLSNRVKILVFEGNGYNSTDSGIHFNTTQGSAADLEFKNYEGTATASLIASTGDLLENGASQSVQFDYSGTGVIALGFQVSALSGSSVKAEFDNLSITIPEPASLGLIAAAGAGIFFVRRRFII